ncbi:hypothetical protein Ssi03_72260 [Sphaerisporangium siamense]|uniref:Excisionase family DNA binding protein n=1 Tax=Sphaerisporangium siamense TaxID=795645 RepID=A0A7W7D353_9ACTN|nr:helix-turn-helix domain-containing protein [Sphaerisporangium siamense]MBB4699327.1 excisionase family DNA binding protein [Sphaerisporangium siamense]GII89236.1 hypothetical protein Ssi03_72260 [Sphaerisporangium siamense]
MANLSWHAHAPVIDPDKRPEIDGSIPVYLGVLADGGRLRHAYRVGGKYVELPLIAGGSVDITSTETIENLPLLLLPAQARAQLNCSKAHFYRLIAAGELETVVIGQRGRGRRIPRASLLAYIERLRGQANTLTS